MTAEGVTSVVYSDDRTRLAGLPFVPPDEP